MTAAEWPGWRAALRGRAVSPGLARRKRAPAGGVGPEPRGRGRPLHPVVHHAAGAAQARAAGEASPARRFLGRVARGGAPESPHAAQHAVRGRAADER